MERIIKKAFYVIGKQGSTNDGDGFVSALWQEANTRFSEVVDLADRDEAGNLRGIWGAMSDFSMRFAPWEDGFSKGLYLAGIECRPDALAPDGWVKWAIPGFEYLKVPVDSPDVFPKTIEYLRQNGINLAGAVQDFTDPATQKGYMLFPIAAI